MDVKERAVTMLEATPSRALVDEEVHIRVSGSLPGRWITIIASTMDEEGRYFDSKATFEADADGCVDLTTQQPVSGSYSNTDPKGLFWSILPVQKKHAAFTKTTVKPMIFQLSAYDGRKALAHTKLELRFLADDVVSEKVNEKGLVGQLYRPKTKTTCPGVVVVGGSDGAVHHQAAALLASKGYATLALAYFAAEGLPENIKCIPLEYVETTIKWFGEQDGVDKSKLAIVGFSRGSELALLAGTAFSELKAIIAVAPSALVFSGLKKYQPLNEPAWTYKGEGFRFFPPPKFNSKEIFRFFGNWFTGKPISNLQGMLAALSDTEKVNEVGIPVERIMGRMMLIWGEDDQLQPSSFFAKMIQARLREHDLNADRHVFLCYEDAGHFSTFPAILPAFPPMIKRTNRAKMSMVFGGTPQGSAHAATDSFNKVLVFLEETFEEVCHEHDGYRTP